MQALPAGAESLCIVEQPFESGAKSALHLNIGLSNGVLLRTTLDSVSGDLADTRTRFVIHIFFLSVGKFVMPMMSTFSLRVSSEIH